MKPKKNAPRLAIIALAIAYAAAPLARAYTEDEAALIAKTIYGEARGVESAAEKAAVAWTILNRVDADGYGDTVEAVVTAKGQFAGYSPKHPATEDHMGLARDVLARWEREKAGEPAVGRTLPKGYLYFSGDGKKNRFRKEYKSGGKYWDWAWGSPYPDDK